MQAVVRVVDNREVCRKQAAMCKVEVIGRWGVSVMVAMAVAVKAVARPGGPWPPGVRAQ